MKATRRFFLWLFGWGHKGGDEGSGSRGAEEDAEGGGRQSDCRRSWEGSERNLKMGLEAQEKGRTAEERHGLLDEKAALPSPKASFLLGSWGRRAGPQLQQ